MSASQALDKTRGRINPPVMTEHGTWHTADATFMSTGRQLVVSERHLVLCRRLVVEYTR